MIVSHEQRAQWQHALQVDGSQPPFEVVGRCIALMGEPDIVIAARVREDPGTVWQVVACSTSRLMMVRAATPQGGWTANQARGARQDVIPHDLVVTGVVHPLSAVTHVTALEGAVDREYFHAFYGEEGHQGDTTTRFGWEIHFAGIAESIQLGPHFSDDATTEDVQTDAAARIIQRIFDSWG